MQELLLFTPSYTVVGIYRLLTDPPLRKMVWDKIRHGVRRGAIVGAVWAIATFRIQRLWVSFFLMRSPRVTGLSHNNMFGFGMDVSTYATFIFMSSQIQSIIEFFLGKNIRIARERAWDQVLASRGKGPEFWGPYAEEWQKPPHVGTNPQTTWERWATSSIGRMIIKRVLILPLSLYPVVGLIVTSGIKAVATARYLHKPYFQSKKMTPHEVAVFMKERKPEYYAFGFAAALLESTPLVGLFFTISNRIGACMWAFDLEKRQQRFRSGEVKPIPPHVDETSGVGLPGETATANLLRKGGHTPGEWPAVSIVDSQVE